MHDGVDDMAALIRRLESLLDEAPTSLRSGGLAGQRCLHGALEDMEVVLRAMRQQAARELPSHATVRLSAHPEQAGITETSIAEASTREASTREASTREASTREANTERLRRVLHRCRKNLQQSQEVLSHLQRWVDARRAEGGVEQNYGEGERRGPGAVGSYGRGAANVLPLRGSVEAHG